MVNYLRVIKNFVFILAVVLVIHLYIKLIRLLTRPKIIYRNFIDKTIYDFDQIESILENASIKLRNGGISLSTDNHGLESNLSIAFIIPYRNRSDNLKTFLNNMHRFLNRQTINYGFFLIEPLENVTFNRGILMNIGFAEVSKAEGLEWNCFFFHDVDMIPEDNRTTYECNKDIPIHYAVAVNKYDYK